MRFFEARLLNWLPCPPPGYLSDTGFKPTSPTYAEPLGRPYLLPYTFISLKVLVTYCRGCRTFESLNFFEFSPSLWVLQFKGRNQKSLFARLPKSKYIYSPSHTLMSNFWLRKEKEKNDSIWESVFWKVQCQKKRCLFILVQHWKGSGILCQAGSFCEGYLGALQRTVGLSGSCGKILNVH